MKTIEERIGSLAEKFAEDMAKEIERWVGSTDSIVGNQIDAYAASRVAANAAWKGVERRISQGARLPRSEAYIHTIRIAAPLAGCSCAGYNGKDNRTIDESLYDKMTKSVAMAAHKAAQVVADAGKSGSIYRSAPHSKLWAFLTYFDSLAVTLADGATDNASVNGAQMFHAASIDIILQAGTTAIFLGMSEEEITD